MLSMLCYVMKITVYSTEPGVIIILHHETSTGLTMTSRPEVYIHCVIGVSMYRYDRTNYSSIYRLAWDHRRLSLQYSDIAMLQQGLDTGVSTQEQ